jgi:hypothetical protein
MSVLTVMVFGLAILIATLAVGAVWPRKGKWGINLSKVFCPRCAEPMPMIRKPNNQRQALWGG